MTTAPAITAPLPIPRRAGRALIAALAVAVLVVVAAVTFAIGRATAPAASVPAVTPTSHSQIVLPYADPQGGVHCHPATC